MNLKINSILQVYGRVQQDDPALQRFRAWRVGEDHFSVRQGKDFNHIFSLLFSELLASIKIGVFFVKLLPFAGILKKIGGFFLYFSMINLGIHVLRIGKFSTQPLKIHLPNPSKQNK